MGESKIRGRYIESLKPLMANWYKSINYNFYDYGISEPVNYDDLRLNSEFLFHIRTQLNYCNRYMKELSGLYEEIKRIQELITIEITRLEKNN